jgi:WD40 repeat protein/serine/threonine protein kinase
MDPEIARRIDEILHHAVGLEGEAQKEFLDHVCAGDSVLRREVAAMLQGEADTGEILKHSPAAGFRRQFRFEALQQGDKIGHYRIESHIGSGGMGEVYLARDEQLLRQVAIKILPPEFSMNAERVRRFEEEAHTVSRLRHPNIITIHDIGAEQTDRSELHFIVTEFVEGQTLREYLKQPRSHAPGDWRGAVDIAIQIAAALQAAHTAGVIHRDIKPENVVIQKDGHVKVLDFGIAKLLGSSSTSGGNEFPMGIATRTGAQAGTLRYMSPEQARGEHLDTRTDIFSLGIVLFEMLTGRHPYGQAHGEEIIHRFKSAEEVEAVGNLCSNLPGALERIVMKALRKSRNDRYTSAGELLNDLNDLRSNPDKAGLRRTKSADQKLTQFVVHHEEDKTTRIPLLGIWTIWRFAELKHGKLERALIRKSLRTAFFRIGGAGLVIATATMALAAWLSVTETWDEQTVHDGHTAAVRRAAFSPDGRLLVSVGEDRKVIVWDFARRQRLATFDRDHTDWIGSVSFSPDGKWFATASYDKTVIVWNAVTLAKETVLRGHHSKVLEAIFTPDSKTLVSSSAGGSMDATILWRVGSWRQFAVIPVPTAEANSVLFVPGSKQMIYPSGGGSFFASTWDTTTGQALDSRFDPDWSGNNAALSPDGALLVSITNTGEVIFADFKRHRTLSRNKAHQDNGRAVAFSPDGRFVVTGAENVILWDAATSRKITTIDYPSIVWSAAFSPDGHWLITTHGDGSINVWDMAERRRAVGFNEHNDSVRAVAWSRDNKRFASAGDDGTVMLWKTEDRTRESVLFGHVSRIAALAFAPDGRSLASADFTGIIIVWDLAQRRERLRFGPPQEGFSSKCLVFSPDGHFLATSHGVYDSATGRQVASHKFQSLLFGPDIYGLAFSPDGSRLAAADAFGQPFVIDTATWQVNEWVDQRSRQFISVSFSPDGERLVTGEDNGTIQLWTVQPLRPTAVLGKHEARVKSVTFSPDGRQVVSSGDDKMIALWDVGARKLNTRIGLHTAPVYAVAFSPDGRQLLSGEYDHSVRLYTRHQTLWGWRWDRGTRAN